MYVREPDLYYDEQRRCLVRAACSNNFVLDPRISHGHYVNLSYQHLPTFVDPMRFVSRETVCYIGEDCDKMSMNRNYVVTNPSANATAVIPYEKHTKDDGSFKTQGSGDKSDQSYSGKSSNNQKLRESSMLSSPSKSEIIDSGETVTSERRTHMLGQNDKCTKAEEKLSNIHLLLRSSCVELFEVVAKDLYVNTYGNRRIGQVGLRCVHCKNMTSKAERKRQAYSFPRSVKNLYDCYRNWYRFHFPVCTLIPNEIRSKFSKLNRSYNTKAKIERRNTSQYFEESAKADFKLVDGKAGIFFDEENSNLPLYVTSQNEFSNFGDFNDPRFYEYATLATDRLIDREMRLSPTENEKIIASVNSREYLSDYNWLLFRQIRLGNIEDNIKNFPFVCKHCDYPFIPKASQANESFKAFNRDFSSATLKHVLNCEDCSRSVKLSLSFLKLTKNIKAKKVVKRGLKKEFLFDIWNKYLFTKP